jgi:exonuclease SbcD
LAEQAASGVPVISTGHLYAKGASSSGEQNNIYIGNLENITAEQFPTLFDYIALGHIHRPQKVGKQHHIRYCGSLIPLSFSEISDKKLVLICDFEPEKGLKAVREIPVPVFRRLATLRGSLSEIESKLTALDDPEAILPTWAEIVVEGDPGIASLDRHLRDYAAGMRLDILKIRNERKRTALDESVEVESLDALTPEEVFLKRCETMGIGEAETTELLETFRRLTSDV